MYKDTLLNLIDEVEELYSSTKQTFGVKNRIDAAKRIATLQKSTEDDFKQNIESLKKVKKNKEKAIEEAKKQAQANVEKVRELEKQALEEPDSLSKDGLIELARVPTKNNLVRPPWTYIDGNGEWKLDANKLADTIAEDIYIRRVEEKGIATGFSEYLDEQGQWQLISKEKLSNLIDTYFKNPTQFVSDAKTKQFAEDLHDAKAVRDVLTLLISKITEITPAITFDAPSKYLVHLKNCDFDVLNWKPLGYDPEHYFVAGLNHNLDTTYVELLKPKTETDKKKQEENQKSADAISKSLAVHIQAWLLESLGEETTVTAFLERLGLSFLHTYEDNFFVFVKSDGGHGKSFLFNFLGQLFQTEGVLALDLDQMCSTDSFDASELRQKDINLTSEVTTTYVPDGVINIIKGLTGNDRRDFSQKYKSTAGFTNRANLWFNMNHLPRFETYDEAVARRADIFSWNNIEDFNKKYPLKTLQSEIPELILLALYHAHEVITRSPHHYSYFNSATRLTRSPQMIDNYIQWSETNDFLSNFIQEECSLGTGYKIGARKLLTDLNNYIRESGSHISYGMPKLTDKLESMKIYKSSKQSAWYDENGKRNPGSYVFEGITLNKIAKVQAEDIAYESEVQKRFDNSPFTAKYKFKPDE